MFGGPLNARLLGFADGLKGLRFAWASLDLDKTDDVLFQRNQVNFTNGGSIIGRQNAVSSGHQNAPGKKFGPPTQPLGSFFLSV